MSITVIKTPKGIKDLKIDSKSDHAIKWYMRSKEFKNSRGSNHFDPETMTATSYNWWPYLMMIKGKLVFNSGYYSNQTSGQQRSLEALLKQLGVKYIEVSLPDSNHLRQLTQSVEYLYKCIYKFEIELKNTRCKRSIDKDRNRAISRCLKEIKQLRSLGTVCSKVRQGELKEEVLQAEKERLDTLSLYRREKTEVEKQAREKLKDLGAVDFSVYDQVNSLKAI